MNTETLKLLLSVWGATLSTILAFIAIYQFNKDNKPVLLIDGNVTANQPGKIVIYIANCWKRPVTLLDISIGLGIARDFQTLLFTQTEVIKINESDTYSLSVSKNSLNEKIKSLSENDLLYTRLWVNVKLSNKKIQSEPVYIDPSLFNISVNPKYDQFISTAAFLDYEIIDKYNEIWQRKMKYVNK